MEITIFVVEGIYKHLRLLRGFHTSCVKSRAISSFKLWALAINFYAEKVQVSIRQAPSASFVLSINIVKHRSHV